MAKNQGGLTKWFKEEWVDLRTGKECGRKSANDSSRAYPVCRPKKVAGKMTAAERKRSLAKKTGPKRVQHDVTASGKRRKK